MLSRALSFPRTGDDWWQAVLLGGVFSLLSVFIIPAILINGYLLRVLRAGVEADPEAPKFEDWWDLFVDGVLLWVVQLVYVGIPGILFAVVIVPFVFIASVSTSTGGVAPQASPAGGLLFFSLLFVIGLLFLLAVYVLPAALANFARTGEFTAAFHLRTVIRAAFTVDYLLAVILVVVVSVVLGFVSALLSVVLVGIFVLFYLQMVVYHLFGQGFARGLDLESPASETGD